MGAEAETASVKDYIPRLYPRNEGTKTPNSLFSHSKIGFVKELEIGKPSRNLNESP